ncbi:LOW QUALITY PROTEIN: hypothetical protein PHMEG_00025200 [Phytophthora megakarya]|uniref:Uncharacterized protein n=1 Tax=Phytophthora megakarya TaxID=4795 RepID=A0A225VCM2_9STRA|nr:LOW QUALITY PROTEIN: hypothetical protein PHMEG_00025200 [Phytophthora megakarya]
MLGNTYVLLWHFGRGGQNGVAKFMVTLFMCGAGAIMLRQFRGVIVRCWSDNVTAVSWCNRLYANNAFSQEINRAIGLAEAYFNIRVSADHLPGSSNRMADAASRAWTEPHLSQWTNFSFCWTQTPVPSCCRKPYMNFSSRFKADRWPRHQKQNTLVHGPSGHDGASGSTSQHGYRKILENTLINLPSSLRTFGWDRSGTGNTAGTVLSKISHIAWHHRRLFGYSVGLMPGHQLVITGMRRSDPPSNPKAPITIEILRCLHRSLNFQDAQHRVIWGASVLGFFFLLRRSEYLAHGSKILPYAIQRSDLKFADKNGGDPDYLHNAESVIIQFRGSKSDQFGKGTSRVMARSNHAWCCPVRAAWYLVKHH